MSDHEKPYVCTQCGVHFPERRGTWASLEDHWRRLGHGPHRVQADGVDRARVSLLGNAATSPERVRDDAGGKQK